MRLARSAALLAATCLALAAVTPPPSLSQPVQLPSAAGAWSRADSVGVYAGKALYLLVDGGADLFFEYGFVRALASEYSRPPGAVAATELYEMKSAAAAYGLFTSFTAGTGSAAPVGQEAVLGEGYCIFWKGTCVGMLTAASSDSSSGPALLDLAEALSKEIRHAGEIPQLSRRLRAAGFDPRHTVYVRGRLAAGNQFPGAWVPAFPPAEGVVGTSGGARFLILEYPDAAAAAGALDGASAEWKRSGLAANADEAGRWGIREGDGDVSAVERHGRYVVAVSARSGRPGGLASRLKQILPAP
jgi:hypothetical protein